METSDIPVLVPKYFFGLTTGLSNNCFFLNDEKIVYHASGAIVIHDTSDNSQEFMYLNEPQKEITTMDLNNAKTILAVAEKGKKPTISMYNLINFKFMRQLTLPLDSRASYLIKIQFSHDDAFLAALTGGPDYMMYYFNWRHSMVDSQMQVINPPRILGPVVDMALNPSDNNVCCFVGDGLFHWMVLDDMTWKRFGFHKANQFHFTTVCWLDSERVIAGTVDGRLFLINKGELKAIYNVAVLTEFDPNHSLTQPLSVRPLSKQRWLEVNYCTLTKGGLMFVVDRYRVYYYKLNADQKFKKSTVFLLSRDMDMERTNSDINGLHDINTIFVIPKSKTLFCVTKRSQLFMVSMNGKSGMTDVPIEPFGETIHQGGVSGLSFSSWKPVFITAGKLDRTVKMWTYKKRSLLLTQNYSEPVLSVSLHPTGLYAVVALTGEVHFSAVYRDGLKPKKVFDVVECHITRFSFSGHMFTLVHGLMIDVYCSVTFEKRFALSGHQSTITDMIWAANDWKLYSCDNEGRICQFNLHTGQHLTKNRYENQYIYGVAVSNSLKEIYSVAQDGSVREIYNQTIIRDKKLDRGSLNAIILSRSNLMLFVASQYGSILSMTTPFKSQVKFKEFSMHNKPISKMRISIDDSTLITCSVDGSICVWSIQNSKINYKNALYTEEILISSKFLNNKLDTVLKINMKFKQLAKLCANDRSELIKAYDKQLQELNEQHEIDMKRLEKEKQQKIKLFEYDKTYVESIINTTKEEHEQEWKTLKDNYEERIQHEHNKYTMLDKEMKNTKDIFEKETNMSEKLHKQKIQELYDKMNRDINEKENVFQKFKEEINEKKKHLNKKINEFEDQGDREVLELRIKFGKEFHKLTKRTSRAREELNKYEGMVKKIKKEDLKELVDKYRNDIEKMKISQKVLDEKIIEKERAFQKCNEIIRGKDELINEEKIKMKTVEKHITASCFIREEQEKVIEPLKNRLSHLETTNHEMCRLLMKNEKDKNHLRLLSEKVQEQIKSTTKEIAKLKKFVVVQNGSMNNLKIDLLYSHSSSDNIIKLKQPMRELYQNCLKTNLSGYLKSDLFRQRTFLERCLDHLKRRRATIEMKKPSHLKKIEENQYLLEMNNKMKREAEVNRAMYNELLCLLGQNKPKLLPSLKAPSKEKDGIRKNHNEKKKNK